MIAHLRYSTSCREHFYGAEERGFVQLEALGLFRIVSFLAFMMVSFLLYVLKVLDFLMVRQLLYQRMISFWQSRSTKQFWSGHQTLALRALSAGRFAIQW